MVKVKLSVVKYILFLFNLIFVIAGLSLIVLGIIFEIKGLTVFGDSSYVNLPILLISLGCLIFVLAFLGCCGAINENIILLALFGILMIILFICQIAVVTLAMVNRGKTEEFIKHAMMESLKVQKNESSWEKLGKRKVWSKMQADLKCCGVEDPKDYDENDLELVPSCCEEPANSSCTVDKAFKEGCYDKIKKFINKNISLVGGVGAGVAVVEILAVLFAFYLAKTFRNRNKARSPPPDSSHSRRRRY